jgi:hypothetical protein
LVKYFPVVNAGFCSAPVEELCEDFTLVLLDLKVLALAVEGALILELKLWADARS